ncbi:MAG TPA: DUF2304 domain-containing protein [Patescibacteria group bacterium]|jgi:hypothetical protein|nr:DUF2304 domain-containing protein [Patescibacteria group bacterium]
MIQQILASLILFFFILKLFRAKKRKHISSNEFIFWLIFWLLGLLSIILIKPLDQLLKYIGFSSSGINLIFYLAVLFLFYLIFRMRIRLVQIEKDLTKLSRDITLNEKS